MNTVSSTSTQSATTKNHKVRFTRSAIARKVIAFQELINLEKRKNSAREAAGILEVPNSTMQSWRGQKNSQGIIPELKEFFSSPVGADFLQRNIMSVMKLMKCGSSGICGMQEYLHNSGLCQFVSSSEGALQNFWVRCENYIVGFADCEESRLATGMRFRKITAGLDEMFRGKRPCLVAMDVVSNYILLEKFTENRTAETWKKELEPRLNSLNIEVNQVVSDLCGAIRAVTKDLGAVHISELFHAQYEISKATSAPLASQERASEKAWNEAEEKVKTIYKEPRKLKKKERKKQILKIEELVKNRDGLKTEFEQKTKRREEVKLAVKEMGKIHHPIDLRTGTLQTTDRMEKRFNEQFKLIKDRAQEANLSEPSMDRIEKAHRAFDAILLYMKYFFLTYAAFIRGLNLCSESRKNFLTKLYFH